MTDLVKKAADSIAESKGDVYVRLAVSTAQIEAIASGLTGPAYCEFLDGLVRELVKKGQDNTQTLASVRLAVEILNQQQARGKNG
jgi:hypothetical protein